MIPQLTGQTNNVLDSAPITDTPTGASNPVEISSISHQALNGVPNESALNLASQRSVSWELGQPFETPSPLAFQEALRKVSENSLNFLFLPINLRSREICLVAVTDRPDHFCIMPTSLQEDPEFRSEALLRNPEVFRHLPPEYQEDPNDTYKEMKIKTALFLFQQEPPYDEGAYDPYWEAPSHYYRTFETLDATLRMNPDIIQAAMMKNKEIVKLIPLEGWSEDIAWMIFQSDSWTFPYIPEPFRSKPMCLQMKTEFRFHWFLEFIPKSLKDADPEFCISFFKQKTLQEVSRNFLALENAHFHLQNDRDICLAAVKQNWRALLWVPKAQRSWEILLIALKQDLCAVFL